MKKSDPHNLNKKETNISFACNHYVIAILLILSLFTGYNSKGQSDNTVPKFEIGASAGMFIGQASAPKKINPLLRASDIDKGQLLTWSIVSPPAIGTLSGFPNYALSGGDMITTDGTFKYHPTAGQTGKDEFKIQISDGFSSSIITIHVDLLLAEPPGNPGNGDIDEINLPDNSRNILVVQHFNDIQIPFGSEYTDIVLPNGAAVTYVNGAGEFLPVSWCSSNFNGRVSKEYVLTGDLILTKGYTNDTYLKAQIKVTVLPNIAPAEIILSDSILGPWPFADPDLPPNLFTTNDIDDNVHQYQLVDGAGDSDNCKFSVRYGVLLMKDREHLKTQSKFYIRVRSTDSNNNYIEKDFRIYYLPKGNGGEEEGEVEEEIIPIPSAFSPNGDGINDLWIIPGLEGYENVDIKVYDRSSNLMFHTNNPEQGWNGRNPNGKIIAGAYFYIVRVGEINLKKQGVLIVLTN